MSVTRSVNDSCSLFFTHLMFDMCKSSVSLEDTTGTWSDGFKTSQPLIVFRLQQDIHTGHCTDLRVSMTSCVMSAFRLHLI